MALANLVNMSKLYKYRLPGASLFSKRTSSAEGYLLRQLVKR